MKPRLAALLGLAITARASAEPVPPRQDVLQGDQPTLLRDYALAACLGQAFPSIAAATGAAANGYVQYGTAPMDAYEKATALARDFLRRDYPSQSGADLSLMKCIDLSHSPELDALVRTYARTPARKR